VNKLKLDHIAINVDNMEKSIHFYNKVLCLEILNSVDMGDHHIQYFDLGHGSRLELIKYNFKSEKPDFSVLDKGIYRHLALETDNAYSIYERVIKKGITPCSKPSFQGKLGFINFLIEDPNGIEIEILQYK